MCGKSTTTSSTLPQFKQFATPECVCELFYYPANGLRNKGLIFTLIYCAPIIDGMTELSTGLTVF
ncbi:hypothetical protein LBR04_17370 [Levilactobacillus brevis]|nr:hypothetical protein LBR02_07470 [Levilactobacillus brevis]GEB06012.1 hypothetical protein LBR03_08990 [Levilactobacillus brevis]GEB74998.1 hypothetical protein LBR04_17370 [Levilactobacillus brevis]